jgi:endonuclease/exonuclease/phosphatase family metal-dependent hydrolase
MAPAQVRGDHAQRMIRHALVFVYALAGALVAAAQPLAVATWNLNWLMDEPTRAQWAAACGRLDWPANLDALPPADRATLAGLPFCDVHNGMAFPPDACASDRDGWPARARYPDDHPCRETMDLAAPQRYAQKIAALRAMFARLDALGVRLVALQETFDAYAVRAILPPDWSVATTREHGSRALTAQHVGVAWKSEIRVRDIRVVDSLADSGVPDRPLRPGLSFTVDVGAKPVRVLVVHLKAGCRSRDLDAPLTDKDAVLAPERQDAIASDCALLRYQLPALETWIDNNAAHDFAILGDFNRTLLREPVADSASWRTRLDGTAASDPLGACTIEREGNRYVAKCSTRTRAMFPELNDGQPPGAVLWRSRFVDQSRTGTIPKGSSGDCSIPGRKGDLTHDGIDHIVMSASLRKRLAGDSLTMRVINYADAQGRPLRGAADVALPSDHCPHVATWTPLPARP